MFEELTHDVATYVAGCAEDYDVRLGGGGGIGIDARGGGVHSDGARGKAGGRREVSISRAAERFEGRATKRFAGRGEKR